jgi:hypothetical protein
MTRRLGTGLNLPRSKRANVMNARNWERQLPRKHKAKLVIAKLLIAEPSVYCPTHGRWR